MADVEPVAAFLFGGTLVAAMLLLLLWPLVVRLRTEPTRAKSYALLALLGAVAAVALIVIWQAIDNPVLFAPFVALVVGLRLASPTMLYRSAKRRFGRRERVWPVLRVLLVVAFVAFAAFLIFSLIVRALEGLGLAGDGLLDAIGLSEQVVMAAGGAFVIVRVLAKVLPASLRDRPRLWAAAILVSVAFAVMAPYAFGQFEYEVAYNASGIGGWLIGFLVAWKYPHLFAALEPGPELDADPDAPASEEE